MDTRKLTEILRGTIDPNQRQQAEEQLAQVSFKFAFINHMLEYFIMRPNYIASRNVRTRYMSK